MQKLTTTDALTIPEIFVQQVAHHGDRPSFHFVVKGESVTWDWNRLSREVSLWTAALHHWGVRFGDRVSHWSANRYEWVVTDLALHAMGAIHVPIHSTLSVDQTADQIIHSESQFVIVADGAQLRGLQNSPKGLASTVKFCSYDQPTDRLSRDLPHYQAMLSAADSTTGEQVARDAIPRIDPASVTTILYTSGTTGDPKGIMLSQRNLVTNATALVDTFRDEPQELRLNFLPLSHIFARTCDLYTWLARGSELALTQSRETIIDDCKRFHPTLINGVPFFFDRVRQKIEEKGFAEQPGILRKTLGGQIRGCFSGGGALGDHTYDYYESQGVPLMQGYGLTETSPVISFSTLQERQRGSAGPLLDGVEVKIAADGEILTRGPHVMLGYWNDDFATNSIFKDGWLSTGDLGRIDDRGHLWITGRKKEMLVTSTGKNVFPAHIEERLCRDPLILQAVVFGDQRRCLSALIVPDPDVLRSEIKRRKIWVFTRRGAVRHRRVVELFRQRIDQQLKSLAHHEQVPLFRILDRGFTLEDGYMTAKLSLRRSKIATDFSHEIDAMYDRRS